MEHRTHIRYSILLLTTVATLLATTACASSLTDTSPEVLEYCTTADAADTAPDEQGKDGSCIPSPTPSFTGDPATPPGPP